MSLQILDTLCPLLQAWVLLDHRGGYLAQTDCTDAATTINSRVEFSAGFNEFCTTMNYENREDGNVGIVFLIVLHDSPYLWMRPIVSLQGHKELSIFSFSTQGLQVKFARPHKH